MSNTHKNKMVLPNNKILFIAVGIAILAFSIIFIMIRKNNIAKNAKNNDQIIQQMNNKSLPMNPNDLQSLLLNQQQQTIDKSSIDQQQLLQLIAGINKKIVESETHFVNINKHMNNHNLAIQQLIEKNKQLESKFNNAMIEKELSNSNEEKIDEAELGQYLGNLKKK